MDTPPTSLVPLNAVQLVRSPSQRLIDAFLSGRNPRTLAAYRKDVALFAAWAKLASVEEAAGLLLSLGPGAANEKVLAFRAYMVESGLAPATINRRLAAIRSLVNLARLLGLTAWTLSIPGVKVQTYRDTRGPGRDNVVKMLSLLEGATPKSIRDKALLLLLYTLGLRRSEVIGLDLADVDLQRSAVHILGKGRTQRERLTLPGPAKEALAAWLVIRGDHLGPLFHRLDPGGKGKGRLTGDGLYKLVQKLGGRVGVKTRVHGLRHSAISDALDATGGDVRAVQRFSRHKDPKTLILYDDARRDMAGQIAGKLADLTPRPPTSL